MIDRAGLDRVVAAAVTDGLVPHLVVVAADRDGVIYEGAAGPRSVDTPEEPVDVDTRFRVMSMTKMVCTTTALQLIERGELDLDTPVAQLLPAFAELPVLDGFDGDTPRLTAQRSPATVRQLLTHTSGLGYWFWCPELVRYGEVTGTPVVVGGAAAALQLPLVAHPGERFVYGTSTDWLGLVVEAVAEATLDVVVADRVTGPLGMRDSDFRAGAGGTRPCADVHVKTSSGAWRSIGEPLSEHPDWCSGGHGLHSTPRDYARFQRMLLRGGELDGERILAESTIAAAFQDQTGGLGFPSLIRTAAPRTADTFQMGPGWTWGWGLLVNSDDLPGRRRAFSGGWAGLYNTYFFVDPSSGVSLAVYANSLPFASREGVLAVYEQLERALYAAL